MAADGASSSKCPFATVGAPFQWTPEELDCWTRDYLPGNPAQRTVALPIRSVPGMDRRQWLILSATEFDSDLYYTMACTPPPGGIALCQDGTGR